MSPVFSIIIATYRRPAVLNDCLLALSDLDFPLEQFEVIVVNDGGPALEVGHFRDRLNLIALDQPNAGPAAARNYGAARARGRYLAFTDDDCRPTAGWLAALQRQLSADPGAMVGGSVHNELPPDRYPCSAASQILIAYLYEYYNRDPRRARFFTSNNMAFAREAFLTAQGFNAQYQRAAAEDRELCDRWVRSGRPMIYAADAVVRHAHRLDLRTFWRQHLHYGRGAFQYHLSHARRAMEPVKVEPLEFYYRLLSYPFTVGAPRPLVLSALLLIAQAANAIGFFVEKFSSPYAPPPTVPAHPAPAPSA